MTSLTAPGSPALTAATPLRMAVAGDAGALDALLREHRDAVVAVCRRRLRSRVDADDAVQETMVRAMQSLASIKDERRTRSYLCRIAERVCLDMMRAGARPMPVLAETDVPDEPESLAIRREEAEMVRRTLQALSARQAEALWMRDALGDPIPAVAARLGVTEGSARVLLTRARQQMRAGWTKVAALFPGVGVKLPAPLAKLVGTAGLVPAVAAPAVLIAAVLVLPGLVRQPAAPDLPLPRAVPGTGELSQAAAAIPAPLTTVGSSAPSTTADLPVPVRVDQQPSASRRGPAGAAADRSARVSTPAVDVGVDRTDRDDDDVRAGDPDLLGVGASLGDLAGDQEVDQLAAGEGPALDLTTELADLHPRD